MPGDALTPPAVPPDPAPPPADAAAVGAADVAPVPGVCAPPPASALSRWQRREKAAADALRTFVRDLHESKFGAVAPNTPEVKLELELRVRPGNNWELVFEPGLAEQLLRQLESAHTQLGVFCEGSVYCYKCDATTCAHAAPPSPLDVFCGYDPMGLAEWKEFAQVLIEQKDDRVDQLFLRPPRLVARVQLGHELRERQLASFGRSSKSYSVLGQVVAGYAAPSAASRGDQPGGRVALTFQAVETRGARGEPQVRLNTVARLPGGAALDEWLASDWAGWIGRARDAARFALERIERRVRDERDGDARGEARRALATIPSVLHRLAESLERGRRQEDRRTHHAEHRRQDQRPVHKALEDLAAARPDRCFRDEKEGTLVACGEQGRAHVFNAQGRLVTTFVLPPGGAESRVRTGRWAAASGEDLERLRAAVESAGRSG